jgi:hypothetical protein
MKNTEKRPYTDFNMELEVDKSQREAFRAINNVRGWWSEGLEGQSEKLNDEFIYRHKDLHYSKQKLIEVVPDKKVVWLVTDSRLNFIKEKSEWDGTKVSFDISKKGDKTLIRFTHQGLIPALECFEACSGGWSYYIESLRRLIEKGKGKPDPKASKARAGKVN